MTKDEAACVIADRLSRIEELLAECVSIANDTGVLFDFDVAGYGMGGTYDGEDEDWYASSQSC